MTIAIVLYIIICFLAIAVFLLQQTETGGMGIIGGSSNTMLGTAKTSFLAKVATFFAVMFFVSALFLSVLSSGSSVSKNDALSNELKQQIEQEANQSEETTPSETEEVEPSN